MTDQLAPGEAPVLERLSSLDRLLPVWIGAAMIGGLLVGRLIPELNDALDAVKIGACRCQ